MPVYQMNEDRDRLILKKKEISPPDLIYSLGCLTGFEPATT
jgi:hypothetical protein